MKRVLPLLLLLIFSCKNDSVPVKKINHRPHFKSSAEEFEYICREDDKRAKHDIDNGQMLTYYIYIGLSGPRINSGTELDSLLSKYNICLDYAYVMCTGYPHNCYAHRMNEEIRQRFGEHFTDSLTQVADTLYIKNHPDRVFTYNQCDETSRYFNNKTFKDFVNKDSYAKDFWKTTIYPKGYIPKKKKEWFSSVTAEFVLSKDGKVSDVRVGTSFENVENSKHGPYFERRFRTFISKAKWIPAEVLGIPVNSEMLATVYFK